MEQRINCEFCKKTIHVEKLGMHLARKHNDMFVDTIALTKYFISKKENLSFEIIDEIINEYKETSVLHIETKYKIRFRQYLKRLNLTPKTISDALKSKTTQDKMKQTNKNKYGVENVSQCEKIKDKKKQTFIENYGVDNVWKTREYRVWWEDYMRKKHGTCCLTKLYGNQNDWGWKTITDDEKTEKIKKLHINYKKWYYNLSIEERDDFIRRRSINNTLRISKLEKRIENILFLNDIKYKPQWWINKKNYDFYLYDYLVLEIQGTYWHCDKRFYKENDIVKRNNIPILVSEIWDYDEFKKVNAEKYGYNVIYLWEHDINRMSDEEILNTILNENKINKENNKP